MKTTKTILMLMILILLPFSQVVCQEKNSEKIGEISGEVYLLEREMSDTSDENLQNIATSAQGLVEEIGPQVEWVHSYVTDNKMICVFKYENREALAEHASRAGLEVSDLKKVETVIGPETVEN